MKYNCYHLRPYVKRIYVNLTPDQYEIVNQFGNCLRALVKLPDKRPYPMSFWLDKTGRYFVNNGNGATMDCRRKNENGQFIIYSIPAV